jgi:uncharacterized protein (TIGR02145 family)
MKTSIYLLFSLIILSGCVNTVNDTKELITSCPDNFTDSRDGQTYQLVEIGDQCWMSDTLKIGKIKEFNSSNETNVSEDWYLPTDDDIIEKYCEFESIEDCKDSIGYYYTWDEAMNYSTKEKAQGICPTGWHMPSEDDWDSLEDELGKQKEFTPEKNLNDYFNFTYGSQWEWTSTNSEVEGGGEKYHSVRVHRISGEDRGDRFGSTVRENKYYVRCLQNS